MFDEKKDLGGTVHYYQDHEGKFFKRTSAKRCVEDVFLVGQCQGVEGHNGLHWRYDSSGNFCWSDNEFDPKEGGCSGSTPPDHKNYISPVEMCNSHYSKFGSEWEEVIDPEELKMLEDDDSHEFSVNRPITDPATLEKLKIIQEENKQSAIEFNKGKPRPEKQE